MYIYIFIRYNCKIFRFDQFISHIDFYVLDQFFHIVILKLQLQGLGTMNMLIETNDELLSIC